MIRILSDLHLGHPASPIRTAAQLLPLAAGAGELWFNGDTVETCAAALRERSLALRAELELKLDELGVRSACLPGNHDPDQDEAAWRTLEGGDVLVTHGDMCFRYGSPWSPWVPRILDKLHAAEAACGGFDTVCDLDGRAALAKLYARAFYPRARRFTGWLGKLETISHAAWPPRTPLAILDIWWRGPDMVAAWLERFAPQAKVIVMGHTHRPGVWCRRGRWVVNTGAFHPLTRPLVVECEPGRLAVREVARHSDGFALGGVRCRLIRRVGGWHQA